MSEFDDDYYKEVAQKQRQRDINEFAKRIDLSFCNTQKMEIPKFIEKYFLMDRKLTKEAKKGVKHAILGIVAQPNADFKKETGLGFMLNKNIGVPIGLMEDTHMGICHASYKVLDGNPMNVTQDKEKFKKMAK